MAKRQKRQKPKKRIVTKNELLKRIDDLEREKKKLIEEICELEPSVAHQRGEYGYCGY